MYDPKSMCDAAEKTETEMHDYKVTFYLTGERTIEATYPKVKYGKSQFFSKLCNADFTLLESEMSIIHIDNVLTNSDVLINMKNVMFMRVKEI